MTDGGIGAVLILVYNKSMPPTKHIHRYHRHMSVSYARSVHQRFYSYFLVPGIVLLFVFFVLAKFGNRTLPELPTVTWGFLIGAAFVTFTRLLIAYAFAVVLAVPLALLISHNERAEKILLPLFDVIQSVPVLAFFPAVILFFVHYNFLNAAGIFILILTMMWSIVFSVVGGLQVIPSDVKAAAKIFKLKGIKYLDKLLLPAVVPYLITGSLLAWAGGWNIIIVAEVLHTYIPGSTSSTDLFGIGSVLVQAAGSGQNSDFLMALVVLVAFVAVMNFFVWQRLLHFAERFKFE